MSSYTYKDLIEHVNTLKTRKCSTDMVGVVTGTKGADVFLGCKEEKLTIDFPTHPVLGFWKRKKIKRFCSDEKIDFNLEKWDQFIVVRSFNPLNEYEVVNRVRKYFKVIYGLEGDYKIHIQGLYWTPSES